MARVTGQCRAGATTAAAAVVAVVSVLVLGCVCVAASPAVADASPAVVVDDLLVASTGRSLLQNGTAGTLAQDELDGSSLAALIVLLVILVILIAISIWLCWYCWNRTEKQVHTSPAGHVCV